MKLNNILIGLNSEPLNLFLYLSKFKYNYLTKNNKPANDPYFISIDRDYKLMSIDQIIKYKMGICWDQSYFISYIFDYFSNLTYHHYYIEDLVYHFTHTYVLFQYKNNKQLYWIENAFESHKGIHKIINPISQAKQIHKYMQQNNKVSKYHNNFLLTQFISHPSSGMSAYNYLQFARNQQVLYG